MAQNNNTNELISLYTQLNNSKDDLINTLNELNGLKNENEILQNELNNSKKKNEGLKNENEILQNELNSSKKKNESLTILMNKQNSEYNKIEQLLKDEKARNEGQSKDVSSVNDAFTAYKNSTNGVISSLRSKQQNLYQEYEFAKGQSEELMTQLRNEMNQQAFQIITLRNIFIHLTRENEELKKKARNSINNYQQLNQELVSKNIHLSCEYNELHKSCAGMGDLIIQTQEKCKALQQTCDTLTNDNEKLSNVAARSIGNFPKRIQNVTGKYDNSNNVSGIFRRGEIYLNFHLIKDKVFVSKVDDTTFLPWVGARLEAINNLRISNVIPEFRNSKSLIKLCEIISKSFVENKFVIMTFAHLTKEKTGESYATHLKNHFNEEIEAVNVLEFSKSKDWNK